MRVLKNALAASAALAMIGAPIAAQAAPAERLAAPVGQAEELRGGNLGIVLAALVAVIVGIIIIADDDDGAPESP